MSENGALFKSEQLITQYALSMHYSWVVGILKRGNVKNQSLLQTDNRVVRMESLGIVVISVFCPNLLILEDSE